MVKSKTVDWRDAALTSLLGLINSLQVWQDYVGLPYNQTVILQHAIAVYNMQDDDPDLAALVAQQAAQIASLTAEDQQDEQSIEDFQSQLLSAANDITKVQALYDASQSAAAALIVLDKSKDQQIASLTAGNSGILDLTRSMEKRVSQLVNAYEQDSQTAVNNYDAMVEDKNTTILKLCAYLQPYAGSLTPDQRAFAQAAETDAQTLDKWLSEQPVVP